MEDSIVMYIPKRMTLVFLGTVMLCGCAYRNSQPVSYVNPNIGGVSQLLVPTTATVQVPNSMIRVYPMRTDYIDGQLNPFPLTIISHRMGELFGFFPATGQKPAKQSTYDHDHEIARPYYYAVLLEDSDVMLEFTPGERTGIFRLTFPAAKEKNVLLAVRNTGKLKISDGCVVEGVEEFKGMKAWVYGRFSAQGRAARCGDKPRQAACETAGKQCQAFILFGQAAPATIEFRYGISFISQEQAQANWQKEIAALSFDTVCQTAREKWDTVLDKIRVEGGTEAQKRTFYTALYRCHERMVNITEDGRYRGYDGNIHTDPRNFYVDDWSWDTHLALHPLRTIITPGMEADMLQSYVRMYEQCGWLPLFPELWGDTPAMNCNHTVAMLSDAYYKNIRNFDVPKAYAAMKHNLLQETLLPWVNGSLCNLDRFYLANGFYPALKPGEKETEPRVHPSENRQVVPVTLGDSFDAWNVARLAHALGNEDDARAFLKRAANYQNIFRKEKGCMWPRSEDGKWIQGINPNFSTVLAGRDYFDECNGNVYNWLVQHDIKGLIALMGGREKFTARLDQLFEDNLGPKRWKFLANYPDSTGLVGQFVMGNEPDFHVPYLYNYSGAPWKTQRRVRMLLDVWFKDNIFGIPGDEDGGGMSAFVVFTSMGFYPVTPGLPVYTIGSPIFQKVTVNLENGKKFTLLAPKSSAVNKYIQSAKLNGQPLNRPWFTHQDIMNGGTLELELGSRPNLSWGADPAAAPPSALQLDP